MPANINAKEKIPAPSLGSLMNADPCEKSAGSMRRFSRKAILAVVLFVCLAVGGVPPMHGQTYSVFHSFNGDDGSMPIGDLIVDAQGNIYGTTFSGGSSGGGTVFKLDPSGNETVLHSFSGSEGANPLCGLVMDSSGNLYGTTRGGGDSGWGTVFKLDPSGNLTVLHSFSLSDGGIPQGDLAIDSLGNLYGTTVLGNGEVFKLDRSGNLTVLYSFDGSVGGPTGGVILDSSGNLYGTTGYGEAAGHGAFFSIGTVFRLDPSGNQTVLHLFDNYGYAPSGAYPSGGLIMDSSGNLYGTTHGAGVNDWGDYGTVFKVDPSGSETVLHEFTWDDGASPAPFPSAHLAMDASGNLYGTTEYGGAVGPGTVFKLDPSGNETVLHSFGWDPGEGAFPWAGPVIDAWGNLYGTTVAGGSFGVGTVFKLDLSVRFAAFSAKLDVKSWPLPRFELKAKFTQGTGAGAIDPVSQPVRLAVGTYTVTIPAGSFRALKKGVYVFEGAIDGIELRVHILQTESNSYLIHADALSVDLTALANPIAVNLFIGRNSGATEVTADFERRGMVSRFECPCDDRRDRDRGGRE